MSVCRVTAPCKINLHLRIKEKRGDGFHELESVFAALDFSDSLEFETTGKDGSLDFTQRLDDSAGFFRGGAAAALKIPPEKNLVCRAVSLFREKTGFAAGIRAVLIKRIPAGAGLGGGSSDAASTLTALDRLAGTRLKETELAEMGAALGSDVPFFFHGGTAWVSGRGEKITKAGALPPLSVLLVKPDFSVSTAEAFAALDRRADLGRSKKETAPFTAAESEKISPETLPRILSRPPRTWPFVNDFLDLPPGGAVFHGIRAELEKAGADFAGLSGSGSCCFGIFTQKSTALEAAQKMKNEKNSIKLTFFSCIDR